MVYDPLTPVDELLGAEGVLHEVDSLVDPLHIPFSITKRRVYPVERCGGRLLGTVGAEGQGNTGDCALATLELEDRPGVFHRQVERNTPLLCAALIPVPEPGPDPSIASERGTVLASELGVPVSSTPTRGGCTPL